MQIASKLAVATLVVATLVGSAGSAFADRNQYTRNHSGRRQASFHHHDRGAMMHRHHRFYRHHRYGM